MLMKIIVIIILKKVIKMGLLECVCKIFLKIIVKNSFHISILYKISLLGIENIFVLKKYFLK